MRNKLFLILITVFITCYVSLGFASEKRIVAFPSSVVQIFENRNIKLDRGHNQVQLMSFPAFLMLDSLRVDFPKQIVLQSIGYMTPNVEKFKKNNYVASSNVSFDLLCNRSGKYKLPVSYLTKNMSWSAVYNGYFDEKNSLLDLDMFFSLENMTGIDYKNYNVSFVAGDMRLGLEHYPVREAAIGYSSAKVSEAQTYSDFYRWDYPHKVSIKSGEKSLFVNDGYKKIPVKKTYEYNFSGNSYSPQKQHASIKLLIRNEKRFGLGTPLPKGTIFFYTKEGTPSLIGKMHLPDLSENEDVELNIGKAYDLFARKINVDKKAIDRITSINEYKIVVTNSSRYEKNITINDKYYGTWEVISASSEYLKKDANTLSFKQRIKGGQTLEITYKVKIKR